MILWRGLAPRLQSFLAGATSSVVLAVPFIKVAPFERLIDAIHAQVRVDVFTRWLPDEIAAGVSDLAVFDVVKARGACLHLVDDLHAKLFVVDNREILMGSANVTAAALGLSPRPNVELVASITPTPQELALFLAELRMRSRLATEEEMVQVLAAAEHCRREPYTEAGMEEAAEISHPPSSAWLPVFRSPDRLYGLYSDPEYLFQAKPVDAALCDMLRLATPAGLTEAAFNGHAQQALRANPLVIALDEFTSEPRRFGAVSAWLADAMPESDYRARQAAAQVLIRWLTYFDAERYWIDTPNYSEILKRRFSS
jgi:PLD-like domain